MIHKVKVFYGRVLQGMRFNPRQRILIQAEHQTNLLELQRPSDNTIVLTILTNLLPTAFTILIKPFWVVLNRLLCILRPFDELRKCATNPKQGIKARYTSVSPTLAIWRVHHARHFFLAMVCSVVISTNVLAVALGSPF